MVFKHPMNGKQAFLRARSNFLAGMAAVYLITARGIRVALIRKPREACVFQLDIRGIDVRKLEYIGFAIKDTYSIGLSKMKRRYKSARMTEVFS